MPVDVAPADLSATAARASDAARQHRLGVVLVATSAIAWSFSGVFARLLSVDMWTAVCLRSAIGSVLMLGGVLIVHRRRALAAFVSMGMMGILVALVGAISMVTFVGAFFNTSVANVSVIYSTTPFMAAGLGRIMLGERVPRRTLLASGVVLFGVAIMVSGSFGSGRLFGDMLAFAMAASFALMAVMVRARPGLEMLPVNFLVCVFSGLGTLPFAHPAAAGLHDVVVLTGFAFTSIAFAFFMFLAGARRIPAAEAGLITTLEVVLSPLWVFLLFAEDPGLRAVIGGAIVFAAVIWRVVGDLRGRG